MKLFKDGIRLCWSLLPRKQLLSTTATSHESPSTAEPPQCGDSSAPTPNHALKSDPRLPCAVETQTPNEVSGSFTEGTRRVNSLSLPTIRLPAELQKAVDKVLTRYPSKSLTEDGQALSRYLLSRRGPARGDKEGRRTGKKGGRTPPGISWSGEGTGGSQDPVLRYGKREVAAYAASRLPVSYGVTLRVLNEISRRLPSFQPETMLDFGSGLGTAVWAAHRLWGGSLYEYCCVDTSQEMGEMAASLRRGGEEVDPELQTGAEVKENIPGVYFKQYLPVSNNVKYDLVVSAYTLDDLPTDKLKRMSVASLWGKTQQFLVLIEPGNWNGYENIIEARDMILNATQRASSDLGVGEGDSEGTDGGESLEGHVFAPCPHDLSCPLLQGSKYPCHFAQRVQLAFSESSRKAQDLKKAAMTPKVDCYSQSERELVISYASYAVQTTLSTTGESKQVILTKGKHSELYRRGRQSEWGDLLPLPVLKAAVQTPDEETGVRT